MRKLNNEGNRFVESLRGKLTNNPMETDDEEDAAFATQVAKLKQKLPLSSFVCSSYLCMSVFFSCIVVTKY